MPMEGKPAIDPAIAATPTPASEIAPTQDAAGPAAGLKEAVAQKNGSTGAVIETLDSYGFDIGSTHVSLWNASVVLLVIFGVWFFARFSSKLFHRILGKLTALD